MKMISPKEFEPGSRELKTAPARARKIFSILLKTHPDARIALNFNSPLELFVATVLSAQCTDVRVNIVTKDLFKKYRKVADYAKVSQKEL